MKNSNEEQVKGLFKVQKKAVNAFVSKHKNTIGDRLDALLEEKAKEQGLKLKTKNEFPWKSLFVVFSTLTMAVVVILMGWALRPDIFIPITKLIGKPVTENFVLSGVDYTPVGVKASTNTVTITFPKPIDQKIVNKMVTIEPAVSYSVEMSPDNRSAVIKLSEEFKKGEVYQVKVAEGTIFKDNSYLANEKVWKIPIEPAFKIISSTPRNGVIAPYNTILEIIFSRDDFNLEEIKSHFSIIPKVQGELTKSGNKIVFIPNKPFMAGASYTVVLKGGLTSTGGGDIKDDYTFTFTVSDILEGDKNYEGPMITPINSVFNITKGQRIFAYVEGITKLKVRVYKLSDEKALEIVNTFLEMGAIAVKADSLTDQVASFDVSGGGESWPNLSFRIDSVQNGAYIVELSSKSDATFTRYMLTFKGNVGVYSSNNAKESKLQLWAFDYNTLTVSKDILIEKYICSNGCKKEQESTTNESGYSELSSKGFDAIYLKKNDGRAMILKETNVTPYSYDSQLALPSEDKTENIFGSVMVNKPEYLPGDTIKVTGWFASPSSVGVTPIKENSDVRFIGCYDTFVYGGYSDESKCIQSKQVKTDKFGSATTELQGISNTGNLSIVSQKRVGDNWQYVAYYNVIISEIAPPQIIIHTQLDKSEYKVNDKIVLSGKITDYAGGNIGRKPLNLDITWDSIKSYDSKVDWQLTNGDTIEIPTSKVWSDTQGNFSVEVVIPKEKFSNYVYQLNVKVSYNEKETVYYKDVAAYVSSGTEVTLKSFVKGTETQDMAIGTNATITLKAEDPYTNQPKAGKKITFELYRNYQEKVSTGTAYNEETKSIEEVFTFIDKSEVAFAKTDAIFTNEGEYTFSVNNLKEGNYSIVYHSTEDWVVSQNVSYLFFVAQSDDDDIYKYTQRITAVNSEKQSGVVGETIKITINSTSQSSNRKVLMLVATKQIDDWKLVPAVSGSFDITLTKEMSGGIVVCYVNPVKGIVKSKGNLISAGYAIDNLCTYINVIDPNKKLEIGISTEKKKYSPKEKVKVKINVKRPSGNPVQSKIVITAVDRSIISQDHQKEFLTEHVFDSIFATSNNNYYAYATTANLSTIIPYDYGQGGAGAGSDESIDIDNVRRNFDRNPLWNTNTVTNSSGDAEIEFTLPDSITTWDIKVWGFTEDGSIGSGNSSIVSTQGIYLNTVEPSFLRINDSIKLPIRVTNTTNSVINARIELNCAPCLDRASLAQVSVQPKSSSEVKFPLTVKEDSTISVVIKVDDKQVDSMQVNIPIRQSSSIVPVSTTSFINEKSKQTILSIPKDFRRTGTNITIKASSLPPGLSTSISDDPEILSTPQLSAAITGKVFTYSIIKNSDQRQQLASEIHTLNSYLLERQLQDGSFSWFKYDASDTKATGYAYMALKMIETEKLAKEGTYSAIKMTEGFMQGGIYSDLLPKEDKIMYLYLLSKTDVNMYMGYMLYVNSNINKSELSETEASWLMLALTEIGSTADATEIVNKMLEKTTKGVGNTRFFTNQENVLTSGIILYTMKKLNMDIQKADEYNQLSNWLSMQDVSSVNNPSTKTGLLFYAQALGTGSISEEESINVQVNNKNIGDIKGHNSLSIPAELLVEGDNTIVFSSKGTFYSEISGEVESPIAKAGNGDFDVDTKIHLVNGEESKLRVGDRGFYRIVVTPRMDFATATVSVSLPAGFKLSPEIYNTTEYDIIENFKIEKDSVIYPQTGRNDVGIITLYNLKKSQKVGIVVPFIVGHEGSFGGGKIIIYNPKDAEGATIVDLKQLSSARME